MSLNLAIFNYLMYMYIYLRYDTKVRKTTDVDIFLALKSLQYFKIFW